MHSGASQIVWIGCSGSVVDKVGERGGVVSQRPGVSPGIFDVIDSRLWKKAQAILGKQLPPHCSKFGGLQKLTKSSLASLHLQVFQETQKLKKERRALKAAAAAQKQKLRRPESPSKTEPEAVQENQ